MRAFIVQKSALILHEPLLSRPSASNSKVITSPPARGHDRGGARPWQEDARQRIPIRLEPGVTGPWSAPVTLSPEAGAK